MNWNDQPAWEPAQPSPAEPATLAPPSPPSPAFGGIRRTIATAALAVGLLVVGGTAVVLAADPSATPAPSATTAPSGGTNPSGGTTQPRTHTPGSTKDCPNMGGNGSSGSGSGGSTAPSTNGTESPSTNL
ncbi:MAG TPA: hypothetical protein VFY18_04740 [Candidatus Limnocylindrales bacterium]|nr:hypothetical protein [Candidatus Limnocylindrales bacterium]